MWSHGDIFIVVQQGTEVSSSRLGAARLKPGPFKAYSWNTLYDLFCIGSPASGAKARRSETILYVALKGPLFHGDEHSQLVIGNL